MYTNLEMDSSWLLNLTMSLLCVVVSVVHVFDAFNLIVPDVGNPSYGLKGPFLSFGRAKSVTKKFASARLAILLARA